MAIIRVVDSSCGCQVPLEFLSGLQAYMSGPAASSILSLKYASFVCNAAPNRCSGKSKASQNLSTYTFSQQNEVVNNDVITYS